MHLHDLPTINLTDIGGEETAARLARTVDQACRTLGIFLVTDSSLSAELIAHLRTTATQFFCLPMEEKLTLHRPGAGLGYLPEGAESLAATIGASAPPDPKESFNIGPDATRNRWPQSLPEFEGALLHYYKEMWRISRKLMRVLSLALGMPATYVEEQSREGNSILRATRYPKLGSGKSDALRAGAHTDYGLFSLVLLDEEVGGFEVKPPGGDWMEIQPASNRLAVNIGDLLSRWTNEIWPATLHRVTASEAFADRDRLSFVFLHNPNPDAVVTPLATFLSKEEAPRFQPVIAREYLKAKSKASFERN